MDYKALGHYTFISGEWPVPNGTVRTSDGMQHMAFVPVNSITELWECPLCGCAVSDKSLHDESHRRI